MSSVQIWTETVMPAEFIGDICNKLPASPDLKRELVSMVAFGCVSVEYVAEGRDVYPLEFVWDLMLYLKLRRDELRGIREEGQ